MLTKFSIIIPVYNASKYISQTLDSIFSQSFSNFEVLCVNDGSTDNSLDILKKLAKKEKRLIVIDQKNAGAGAARNNGINKAKGEFILFIDSDDLFASKEVLGVLDVLTNQEECDLYVYGFNRFNDGEQDLSEYKIAHFNLFDTTELIIGENKVDYFCESYKNNCNLFIHNWIAPWNKCYRKSFLKEIGAKFDTIKSVEDRTFHFQTMTKSSRTMMIDYPIVNYRLNVAGSLTNNFNVKKIMNHISAYQSIVENTNMTSEKELKAFFISTVSDVHTFYLKSIESEKEQVFLKMKEFFHSIEEKFKNCKNNYNKYSVFFDIATRLSFEYGNPQKPIIPVVFATNENYAPFAGVAIQSLIENSDKNTNYQVYVFYTKLSNNTAFRLEKLSTDNVHVQTVDITSYVQEFSSSLYQEAYYSVEMYYRMLISTVLPMFDKVVYLDCDIVVLDDVKNLYNLTNFENGELLAGGHDMNLDEDAKRHISSLGLKEFDKYINSGILVLNTKQIRQENTFAQINDVLKKYPSLWFPDQDAINIICANRICYFDSYWNFQWSSTFGKYVKGMVNEKYGVVHYTTKVKPWNNPTMPLSEPFWKYAKHTPFYEQILYRLGG